MQAIYASHDISYAITYLFFQKKIYKVCLLNGYVSIPVMNPSYGTSGKAKCICVACKLVDQYVSMKKYQRPCCGLQKQRLAKV